MKKPHYIIMGGIVVLLPLAYYLGNSRGAERQSEKPVAEQKVVRKEQEKKEPLQPNPNSPALRQQLRMEALQASLANSQKMTPEVAGARLKAAAGIENIDERAMVCSHIIRELCAAGYVDEAWAFIEKDSGKVRSQELDAFFGSLKVDLATFEKRFKELDNAQETTGAMNSRMGNYSSQELVSALSNPQADSEFLKLKNLDPDNFSNGVYNRLHLGLRDLPILEQEGLLSDAFALQQKGLLRPIEPIRMIWKLGDFDAFAKWEKFSEFTTGADFGKDTGYIDHTRESIIGEMIRDNSLQTIDRILKSEGRDGSVGLQLAMQQWSKIDSRGAADWYEKNASTLSPQKQSSAAAGFFGLAYDNGELDVARQWAERITEQKMREGALAAIDRKEKELQGK